jgi:hypothetical protein
MKKKITAVQAVVIVNGEVTKLGRKKQDEFSGCQPCY